MCGIFGIINQEIDKNVAFMCLNRMEHRGPDGWGLYQEPGVTLGHRRLSILDLSDNGKQPMAYANGRYIITFNGEIYNFIEIRRELEQEGFEFKSNSDTEVILAAYLKWGVDCQNHFNGMWAFAIWDKKERTLFMSRDRFGVKPLYYVNFSNSSIGFASEMKSLVPLIKNPTINYELIKSNYFLGYEATEECLIKEIRRLPAGHYLYLTNKGIKIKRWWNTLDHLPRISTDYNEQVEIFQDLFMDACKIRMRSDVTLGTALSGGLDSSATICAMSHIAKRNVVEEERVNVDCQHAFVATFPGTTLDESMYAKQVTDYLGINSTFIDINPQKFVGRLEDYLYLFEEIHSTTPIPMMVTYETIKQSGVTVTLDGHGADEMFGGYAFDFFNAFPDTKGNLEKVNMILSTYSDIFPHDEGNLGMNSVEGKYNIYSDYMKNYQRQKFFHKLSNYKCIDSRHEKWKKMDNFNQILYMRTHQDILPTLLRNYDRYSMAGSVEIRMPFMDYRIVTLAFALQWESKLRKGYSKAIIRDAMSSFMPQSIVSRKTKIGFNTPLVEWMQGEMKEYFEDIITSTDFSNSNLINPKKIREDILRVINGGEKVKFADAERAWTAIAPYLWEKAFFKVACQY